MINLDPVHHISEKLKSITIAVIVNGVVFIILGITIIFFPRIVQYLFIIGFIVVGIFSILAAIKLNHLRDVITRFELFSGNKKVEKK